ncbi:MAG: 30S ribosomal protein S14 [Gammaproteobacteria bacterium]|nr:MAG: 30S ribosomal protein S14 [Gammaproteobacteria bacterium]RLA12504.1 MAG: 30S ribosomal protein S14 [Gammaproteobacteria bacterium]RLA14748.1 MAG: 30S ribosomal protein S14 [Gammaproteobacteria bacterium]
MSKKSVILRNEKRKKAVAKAAEKRSRLKAIIVDMSLSYEERDAAVMQLQRMPRDTSSVRVVNRCRITGRPKGVYRKFGLARTQLREAAMRGDIPGMVKASW